MKLKIEEIVKILYYGAQIIRKQI